MKPMQPPPTHTTDSQTPDAENRTTNLARELIRARRTVHTFSSELPPENLVVDAIESARWAPNHRVTEPWHFYLLGPKTAARLSELNYQIVLESRGESAAQRKLERWLSIPGWLVVTCDRSDSELRQQEDYAACSCAIQNLFLHLWSQGIGAKWGTGAATRHPEFYEIAGIDAQYELIVGLIWYGFPAVVPDGHRTKSVEQILLHRP